MIIKQLIDFKQNKKPVRVAPEDGRYLQISEFFCDTIQGEGVNIGVPSTFLRLQNCTLDCTYCDTEEVWRFGNPYTFDELFELMEKPEFDLIRKLKEGQHLVLTGGSPLKQQDALIEFFEEFVKKYFFFPYIEVENEAVLVPSSRLVRFVKCWSNSPKLEHSGNPIHAYYKPDIVKSMSLLENSWFKFVIQDNADWKEIEEDYLNKGLIRRNQIILMPLGGHRDELEYNREDVIDIAIREGVRYTTREHVILWDTLTGV